MNDQDKIKDLEDEIVDLRTDLSAQQQFTQLYSAVNRAENTSNLNSSKIELLEDELKGVKNDVTTIKIGIEKANDDRLEIKKSIIRIDGTINGVLNSMNEFIAKHKNDLWKYFVGTFLLFGMLFSSVFFAMTHSLTGIKDDIIKILIDDRIKINEPVQEYDRKHNQK